MTTVTTRAPMHWTLRGARAVVIALIGAYALACIALYSAQRWLLFRPPSDASAIGAGLALELVETRASDDVVVHAAYVAGKNGMPTIAWLHGNGEDIGGDVARMLDLRDHEGFGGLAIEYRGYGLSRASGAPSERGLYADVEAGLRWLSEKGIARDRTILVGRSLGSGVATEMAARGLVDALVLVSPFTSIPDVAAIEYPLMPVHLLGRDRFETLAKAPRVTARTLVIHGDHDELVPYAMGVAVSAAIPHGKLLTVEGGHHDGLLELNHPETMVAILAFALAP